MQRPTTRPLRSTTARAVAGATAFVVLLVAVVGLTVWRDSTVTAAAQNSPPSPPVTNPDADRFDNSPRVDARVPGAADLQVLPPGTTEVATVRPTVPEVLVRSVAPPGWDRSLAPVVRPSTPVPPRSAQDLERVRLPSAELPIVGRRVTDSGWSFSNPTRYVPAQPLRFGVVERQGGWVEIQLPVRPNGTTGWVRAAQLEVTTTTLGIEVSLDDRRLRVLDGDQVVMDVPVAIGQPSRPTPTGSFTVTDIVPSTDPAGSYGPVALALDGYSEALDDFPGENAMDSPNARAPVLALHGTNRPVSVGSATSNGCPRLFNDDVVRLAQLVPAGTPVRIWP